MPFAPVSSIVVLEGRTRREIKQASIDSMAESILRIGKLIHPIVLRDDFVLVAGETRLRAHQSLGWDQIEYRHFEELSDEEALEIELEENIKRTDLPWQDQCDGLIRLHNLRKGQDEAWTIDKTAERVGLSVPHVKKMLAVAKELEKGNVRVSSQPKFSTAFNVVSRANERARENESIVIADLSEAPPKPEAPFKNVDFHEWIESYDGQPFNFLHCDFPYGINADKFNQGAADELGGYKDDWETYVRLVQSLCDNKTKLLGTSGHILFWFSMKHYAWTLEALRSAFWVDPYPLIWVKSDNKGTLPDPNRGPRRIYEVAFLCSHGDRKIVRPVSNVASFPTTRVADHMSEKNEEMLRYFFGMLVDSNTRMLDPTAGGGSAVRAAYAAGASSALGLERDPEFYAGAVRAWEGRAT